MNPSSFIVVSRRIMPRFFKWITSEKQFVQRPSHLTPAACLHGSMSPLSPCPCLRLSVPRAGQSQTVDLSAFLCIILKQQAVMTEGDDRECCSTTGGKAKSSFSWVAIPQLRIEGSAANFGCDSVMSSSPQADRSQGICLIQDISKVSDFVDLFCVVTSYRSRSTALPIVESFDRKKT
jgi:hypothetical protein